MICLYLSSFLFIFMQAQAQIKYGIKVGINYASFGGKDHLFDLPSYTKVSSNFGSIFNLSFLKNLGLESGIILSSKGARLESNYRLQNGASMVQTLSFSFLFLEIPLNVSYQFKVRDLSVEIFSGPYFGLGIRAKDKIKHTLYDIPESVTIDPESYPNRTVKIEFSPDGFQSNDFGLNFGAGINIYKFVFKAQYGLGITNIYHNLNLKNRVVGVSMGFMFLNKKT